MKDLNGRVAVVTGGASGIGRGMVEAFIGEGMKVVIGDIEQAALDKTVTELTKDGADVVGELAEVTCMVEDSSLSVSLSLIDISLNCSQRSLDIISFLLTT